MKVDPSTTTVTLAIGNNSVKEGKIESICQKFKRGNFNAMSLKKSKDTYKKGARLQKYQ